MILNIVQWYLFSFIVSESKKTPIQYFLAIHKSTAPYIGIVTKNPITMMDLGPAAVPSKSIDTIIPCPTDALTHRQASYEKIAL